MNAYYNEIDKHAAAWLRELIRRNLIAPGEVDERSIVDVQPDDLRGFTQCHFFAGIGTWSYALRRAGWPDDRPVWTGSCPCQPFSAAGKGDEFADERHLWPAWFRLIRECRPVACFGEQVASRDALAWLDHVSTDLEGAGYAVGAVDTCAAGFGAPHIRQRLYFVADAAGVRLDERGRREGASLQGECTERGGEHARPEHGGELSRRSEGLGATGELADSECAERRPGKQPGNHERDRHDDGRQEAHGIAGACGEVRGMADPAESRRPGAREHDGGSPLVSTRSAEHGVMGDAEQPGLEIERGDGRAPRKAPSGGARETAVGTSASVDAAQATAWVSGRKTRAQPGSLEHTDRPSASDGELQRSGKLGRAAEDARPGPTNGFWSNAEWIACRDGKARPVEPGVAPLASGVAARVVKLRGYGNSICAPVAEEFIRAYLDVRAA